MKKQPTQKDLQNAPKTSLALLLMHNPKMTNKLAEAISYNLKEWAMNDGDKNGKGASLKIDQFLISRQLPKRNFYDWVNKFPVLAEAVEFAKMAIGCRREIGALEGKYNATFVARTIGYYCDIERSEQKRIAELKSTSDMNAAMALNIILPDKKDLINDDYKEE